ncbi:MAG: type II secretion system protein [Lachnospiraceae bacterium]
MEAEKREYKPSDGGYSLIELIVTVLISSVVMMAVVGFLTAGLNHYRTVNSETMLQMESQMTELFLTELFQESTDFTVVDSAKFPAGKDVKAAVEVWKGTEVFMVAQIGNELRFGAVAGGTLEERLGSLADKARSETFLAQYVSTFSIDNASSFSEAISKPTYQGIMVKIKFQLDKKSYDSSSLITLRNTVKN